MAETNFHRSLDPELQAAALKAQESFKHFWYQVATDFQRIVPALSIACVKVPFSDNFDAPNARVEHMWVDEIYFDGSIIRGVLLNSPNELESVNEGDDVAVGLKQIEDWICAFDDDAYGGYSVQVLRSRMPEDERQAHDDAWGLQFPDPGSVSVPEPSKEFEENSLDLLREQIEADRSCLNEDYGEGRTMLHLMCLYGRETAVQALLDAGADSARVCDRGWTPAQYAQAAGWDNIVTLFEAQPR